MPARTPRSPRLVLCVAALALAGAAVAGEPSDDLAAPVAEAAAAAPAPFAARSPAPAAATHAGLHALERFALRHAARQERLRGALHAAWRRALSNPAGAGDAVRALARDPDLPALVPPALGLALCLLLGLRLTQGRGDLSVSIEYPGELRGTFSVRLARRQGVRRGPRCASPAAAERVRRKARRASRTERHLVSREASFPHLRAGRWFVCVDGFLQPQGDESVLASHFEQKELALRRGGTTRIDFGFHPKQCPVDVKVVWDRRPVDEARIAWRGMPHSLRYVRNATARIGADPGDHVLAVGSGDRVAELRVAVGSFQPVSVEVDLADRERLVFSGCPPAVQPYLMGDVQAAARALEREGQHEVAHVLLARHHADRDELPAAARHWEQAGRRVEAAELHQRLANFEASAALFEAAGELLRAGEMYRSAGKPLRAGETFERARELERAIECYREAGDVSRQAEALEKTGRFFEAAELARQGGDPARAIRNLQFVAHDDERWPEAARQLVEAYQREGHLDLAAAKLRELVETRGALGAPLALCDDLARRLEEGGDYELALELLEVVRGGDATWPQVATRIEGLRKLRQLERERASGARTGASGGFGEASRYDLLEQIGRGGMGIVFKARDRRLGRIVALKRLPDNLRDHPRLVDLFVREARAAAALNHPNIVTLFDAGQDGDTYYITMELLEGMPLHGILARRQRLSPADVVKLGIQIAQGLAYAHGAGIVHRDIKTSNLFVTRARVVKVMDFGLAKMVEEVRRASTVIAGTPFYMAPEQAAGDAVDHRADLYALGVTFFELLTGKPPFLEGDVAYHHRHTPPPDPRARVPEIPDALAQLVLRLLAKDPAARGSGAPELVAALKSLVARPG